MVLKLYMAKNELQHSWNGKKVNISPTNIMAHLLKFYQLLRLTIFRNYKWCI